MIINPDKTITLYDVGSLVNIVYVGSFNKANFISWFRKTGICPNNIEPLGGEDYLMSTVSDRDQPEFTRDSDLSQEMLI